MQYVPNSFFTEVIAAGQEHWVASWRGYMYGLIHAVGSLQCAGFDSIGGPLLHDTLISNIVCSLFVSTPLLSNEGKISSSRSI